ncbi:hypothetical protein KM043_018210 [Ampulex compressa]|nr:hypothetical protein KM043_018210 [Ampulex compressa]
MVAGASHGNWVVQTFNLSSCLDVSQRHPVGYRPSSVCRQRADRSGMGRNFCSPPPFPPYPEEVLPVTTAFETAAYNRHAGTPPRPSSALRPAASHSSASSGPPRHPLTPPV